VPPDLRRRLNKLEERSTPNDPTPYAVEVPLTVLRGGEEECAAWLWDHGVKGPVALVPPKLSVEEWMGAYCSPPGDS
jgi:hypothetical protein